MIDRRQSPRDRRECARAPFVAAVRSASDGAVELALSLDLSRTGMRLRRAAPAETAGPEVRIEFELPDGEGPVVARGQLLCVEGDGSFRASGLRFVDLSLEDELRIARFVDDQRGRAFQPFPAVSIETVG